MTVPEGYSQSMMVTVNNTLDLDSLGPASGVYVCNFAFQGTTYQVNSTRSTPGSSPAVNVVCATPSFSAGSLTYGAHADAQLSVSVLSPQANYILAPAVSSSTFQVFTCGTQTTCSVAFLCLFLRKLSSQFLNYSLALAKTIPVAGPRPQIPAPARWWYLVR